MFIIDLRQVNTHMWSTWLHTAWHYPHPHPHPRTASSFTSSRKRKFPNRAPILSLLSTLKSSESQLWSTAMAMASSISLFFFTLFALRSSFLAHSVAGASESEDFVVELDHSNFTDFVSKLDFLIVSFYTPGYTDLSAQLICVSFSQPRMFYLVHSLFASNSCLCLPLFYLFCVCHWFLNFYLHLLRILFVFLEFW